VYARHGHELMGCKSPVGVPALSQCASVITTSRRQGRIREDGSEGSPSAKVRAEEHEPHRRLSPGASQHNMTKPAGHTGQGKCGGCASTVHVLIRGGLFDRQRCVSVCLSSGVLDDQTRASRGLPSGCDRTWQQPPNGRRATPGNGRRDRTEVSRSRSSEGGHGVRVAKGRTWQFREES